MKCFEAHETCAPFHEVTNIHDRAVINVGLDRPGFRCPHRKDGEMKKQFSVPVLKAETSLARLTLGDGGDTVACLVSNCEV